MITKLLTCHTGTLLSIFKKQVIYIFIVVMFFFKYIQDIKSLIYDLQVFSLILCHAQSLSCVRLFETPWTVARQAPLSMEFSRQE